jgi:hypothetical protein
MNVDYDHRTSSHLDAQASVLMMIIAVYSYLCCYMEEKIIRTTTP